MITNMMPVEVHFKPVDGYWTASCPSLDVFTQGENFERAQDNLKEALELFFESCLKRGTLRQVLKDAGYSPIEIDTVAEAANARIYPQALSPSAHQCRV